jgi:photosystem II stability/assembly factor-like uncharacterized protein
VSAAFTICVGTVGSGAWTSADGGDSWRRVRSGLSGESRVYGLAVDPHQPRTVFAGAEDGLYKSGDGGQSFERLDTPMNKIDVWKIAFDPADPDTIFAGTRPAALFRSRDGGRHWTQLPVDMVEDCPNVGVPRVTALTVDPSDHRIVWAGVEVDGVRRSLDGGETWMRIAGGLSDPDIHDVAVRGGGNARTVLTSTPREIFASTDKGESWQGLGVGKQFGLPYCRGLALKADDPSTVFVATGDAAVGSTGAIQRSKDGGQSWQRAELPVEPNSPIWAFATNPSDPGLVLACSHYGELYSSQNAGDSWRKLGREFTEIRALAWTPN